MFLKTRGAAKAPLSRVARLYLAYKFLGALYFTYPIFYQFAQQSLTPVQVGFFFSAIGVIGFLAEIPTGILADKHGRKSSGVLGMAIVSAAPLVIFFGHTFTAYIAAAVLYGLGRALLNGTLESLVYDHASSSPEMYRQVNAWEISFGQAGILASAAAGGLLFSASPGLPFITETAAGAVCVVLIARMDEQHNTGYAKPVATHRQHFIESMRHLFATPFLRMLVFSGVTFSVMLGMCIQFVNEAAMIEHGFQPEIRGFVISGAGIATLVIVHFAILRHVRTDTQRTVYLMGGAALAYTVMGIGNTPLFLLGYLAWCCLNATSSFIRLMLHARIPGSHRATIISNFKALATLVGLAASTLTGLLVQKAGTPRAAYMVFSAISCLLLLPCAYLLSRHLRKEQTPDARL